MKWVVMLAVLAALATSVTVSADTCAVDAAAKKQTIDGFGFSTAWCGTLNAARITALFDTLGMSILRIRIDENYGWNDETNNAKAAHARGLKVLGSPWSAPGKWTSDGHGQGANHYLLESHYADYAAYLQQAATQIGLDIVSIQNEPDYNSWMNWSADQVYRFMKNFSQVITAAEVMPAESFHFDDKYYDQLLNDAAVESRIKYIGGHFYGAGNYEHTNAIKHNKRIWQTEHYFSNSDQLGTSMQAAQEVQDAMKNNFNAYIWWWVYPQDNNLDCTLLSPDGRTIYLNGYTLAQFAKFVRPGDTRIAATYTPTAGVSVTAYTGAHALVIVALNSGNSAVTQTFSVSNLAAKVSTLALYQTATSAKLHLAQGANVTLSASGTFTLSLPAQSISTLVGDGTGPAPPPPPQPSTAPAPPPPQPSTAPAPPPPAPTTICATAAEGSQASLSCPPGKTITAITFASYGLPSGSCPSFSASSSCNAASSVDQVKSACVGKSSCSVAASNNVFGDPCSGRGKTLDIVAQCA